MSLAPCPGCRRHVRVTEPSCPFCAAQMLPHEPSAPPAQDACATGAPPGRHSVMFGIAVGAIAVSTALLGSACFAYGPPSPDLDAGTRPDDAGGDTGSGPDDGGSR